MAGETPKEGAQTQEAATDQNAGKDSSTVVNEDKPDDIRRAMRLPDEPEPEPTAKPDADKTKPEKASEKTKEGDAAAPENTGNREDDGDSASDKDDRKSIQKGVKKRIDELTAARRKAEEERDYWREQAMKQGKEEGKEKAETPSSAPLPDDPNDPKPVRSDEKYDDDFDAYLEDLSAWNRRQAVREFEAKQAETRKKAEEEKRKADEAEFVETVQKKFDRGREKYDDFDEVAESVQATPAVMAAVYDSDISDELAYYLGQHPEEADRLSAMTSYVAVAREIGKLEARLSQEQAQQKAEEEKKSRKKPTTAPDPATTLEGSDAAGNIVVDEKMSHEEYVRLRKAGKIK